MLAWPKRSICVGHHQRVTLAMPHAIEHALISHQAGRLHAIARFTRSERHRAFDQVGFAIGQHQTGVVGEARKTRREARARTDAGCQHFAVVAPDTRRGGDHQFGQGIIERVAHVRSITESATATPPHGTGRLRVADSPVRRRLLRRCR